MEPARRIRDKLDRGEIVTGTLVTNHLWPELVEIAIDAGLDYLIADLEHGPHSHQLVADVCALGRAHGFAVFARPPALDFTTISRVLDLGPCGLLLPTVQSGADLDVVRDAMRLPPAGRRRPGGMGNRWVRDYQRATWAREVEANLIVIPQIESRHGLADAEAIAAHEITTALGIGPYDLCMELGCGLPLDQPDMTSAIATLRRAAEGAGKTMWRIGPASLAKEGFIFLCLGEANALLTEMIRQQVATARMGEQAAT